MELLLKNYSTFRPVLQPMDVAKYILSTDRFQEFISEVLNNTLSNVPNLERFAEVLKDILSIAPVCRNCIAYIIPILGRRDILSRFYIYCEEILPVSANCVMIDGL